jgi:hypothetical protein
MNSFSPDAKQQVISAMLPLAPACAFQYDGIEMLCNLL